MYTTLQGGGNVFNVYGLTRLGRVGVMTTKSDFSHSCRAIPSLTENVEHFSM